jgi:GT2 family glycosyltransferase
VVVTHDYFPYCPAINLHFESPCERCDGDRVAKCERENERFNPFLGYTAEARLRMRERFVEAVLRPNVAVAVPSRSVADNLLRLDARFERARFTTIPHGYGEPLARVPLPDFEPGERLRILILGQLSFAKGLDLLKEALPEITRFADVYMLGAREVGEVFKYTPQVTVIAQYDLAELGGHVAHIRPHVALLASVVPETFSYALSELFMLGVPVAATRMGSFAERIREGETGFLFEPTVDSLLATLRALNLDRQALARARRGLEGWKPRPALEMVADYHRLMPLEIPAGAPANTPAPVDRAAAEEAFTVASMWKKVKSLDLQLALVNDARHRTEMGLLATGREVTRLHERLEKFGREIAERDAIVLQKDLQLQHANAQVLQQAAQLKEIFASTSWRVTLPLRGAGTMLRWARRGLRLAGRAFAEPRWALRTAREVRMAWRMEGWEGARRAMSDLRAHERDWNAWTDYRARLKAEVFPVVAQRVAALPRMPLISIIVPTFDTYEDMLRQMLESIRAQIYPRWELCIVDDASRQPHVRRVLDEYAAADSRIRVKLSPENRGVSHASNRALEMATGEFVVLVDHDDLLEEHALFRVAESILADAPDFLYTDEALTTHDRNSVIRYAYRPAFSLEYLRSHPYIVHLAGFRTQLLRELGGWDESLSISQDYDLILRTVEKARKIVHIPEVLYRWRVHGASAGLGKQSQVMETSKSVLRRHLERCGIPGEVNDGVSFNLFDVRYRLQDGLKVGIVIPTKDHGELLRQCIESIRATVRGVAYDILVVDHESRDPATLEYFATAGPGVQVLRYEGPFNFSAINNWAVAKLGPGYSHYLLCNNDIEAYEEGWLERMLELGQHPDVGIVGAMLFYPDRKTIQHAGVCVGMFGAAEHYAKLLRFGEQEVSPGFNELLRINHEVSSVTAACLLIRADAYAAASGFDEAIAVGFGDVDLCLRVGEKGYRVVFCPFARLVHHESFTRGVSRVDPHPADSSLFRVKWKAYMQEGDPYYSPGLSLTSKTWEFRKPLPLHVDVKRRLTLRP